MTSKLFRTTSVLAVGAFSLTALCAASQTVRAEPDSSIRLAQKADDGRGQNPGAENQNAGGEPKGEGRRRDGNRAERGDGGQRGDNRGDMRRQGAGDRAGERGGERGGDARRNGAAGEAPTKAISKPDVGKPNLPTIINTPNAAEKREAPAAPKPVINNEATGKQQPRAQQPVMGQQPARQQQPVMGQQPARPQQPVMGQQPARQQQPVMGQQPARQQQPVMGQQPVKQLPPQPTRRQFESNRPIQAGQNPRVRNLNDAKSGRVERREDGGKRVVIVEEDKRQIVKQGDRMVIQKDEAAQLRRLSPNAVVTRDRRGRDRTVVERRDNTQVITETDRSGQLLRRYRRDRDGRETVIIDNRRQSKDKFGRNLAIGVGVGAGIVAGAAILNSMVDVPPPRVRVPRDKYIVDYERASEDDVYEALNAPPVDDIDRSYTLDQVRATPYLRERMRRVDLDDITFNTGSWDIDEGQYGKLERIARAMRRVINRNPNEVFLIEGYTDAVGSEIDNLTLSDRRAEAVSVVLTEEFQVPFENLTTQGYGEQYLKIPTEAPERANRRVAARRITPLLNHDVSSAPPRPSRPDYDDSRDYDDRGDRYDEPPHGNRWRRYN